jgi:hypothetical protein
MACLQHAKGRNQFAKIENHHRPYFLFLSWKTGMSNCRANFPKSLFKAHVSLLRVGHTIHSEKDFYCHAPVHVLTY